MDKTLSALITEIESELYQVSGPAVQVYAQDMIVKRINDAFITFFDDKQVQWKRFQTYGVYTLDGATGQATGTVSTLFRQYEHIHRIYPPGSDRALGRWNYQRNPSLILGDQAIFVTASTDASKVFKVLPATATGDVTVVGRTLPTAWPYEDLDVVVPFDYLALKYFVAWRMLVDDGANAESANATKVMFDNRYAELEANQSQEPVMYSGGSGQWPTQWRDSDA